MQALDRFARRFRGDTGDREIDQVILVLFSQFLKSLGNDFRISRLGSNLWFGSRTLCFHFRSMDQLPELVNPGNRQKDLQNIIVAAPLTNLDRGAEQVVRDRLRRTGWKKVDRLHFRTWGPETLLKFLQQIPPLCIRFFPDLVADGKNRLKRVQTKRAIYDRELIKLNSGIQFVGMSVYKEEASAGVQMEKIYIPLRVVPEGAADESAESIQTDPLTLLNPGACHVILGDPGSGKSTLLRFLALAGMKPQLLQRYKAPKDDRLALLIILRRYAEVLQSHPNLGLLDHSIQTLRSDLDLPALDRDFFEFFLYAGQALIFLDGVDELPNIELKETVKQRVADLLARYPGNTVVVTSRIVGYDQEIRFDDLGFTHHRMARLSMEDIQTFVNDWYQARIANRAERDRHANDLIRVLEDPDSRAIRELAENPLLLTIICLVHRIDAELPDERVVLYQKCTETLLNTWHNWKFRGERDSLQSRSKVERRNRSRMEAIAYWMHATLEEGSKEIRRAVVPSDALRDFLAEYIKDNEKLRDEAPSTAAEQFLRFVKEKAGLLIEVGSGQYSFLHLTFQEYLTATHLRKSGETAGMQVVWPFIAKRCGDPKWHEVIRLLVGALEKSESQAFLLGKILPQDDKPDTFERCLVAGGCLIDGVDAAEEMQEEILSALLAGAADAQNSDQLLRSLRMLRTWEVRGPGHRRLLQQQARRIAARERQKDTEIGLALSLVVLGWSERDVEAVTTILAERSRRPGHVFDILFAVRPKSAWSEDERDYLEASFLSFCLESPAGNFCATVLAPLCLAGAAPSFTHILGCMFREGPFEHFFTNCLALALPEEKHEAWARALARARALDRSRALDRARALARALAQDRALAPARDRIRARDRDRDRVLARILARDRDRVLALDRDHLLWETVLSDPQLHGPILDSLCDLLALEPRPHWWAAVRERALPLVPKRMTLADPQVWESTRRAFFEGKPESSDCENAACQLLLDIWLWISEQIERPEDSPFAELAALSRNNDSPRLRIAHCLRDIAYGDESRIRDLEAMVKSKDRAYGQIFERAYWR